MMDFKGYKQKGVLVFDSHIPIIWLLVVGGGYCLFPGVIDMPEKCKFTNLLCNESRLLKEDKIIILNIGNELRNRVAGGTFKYLNLQHDPVTDMNKLYWNEEIARKATMIVSSCPSTSESFINSQTTIESGDNAIDQIVIENSIDPITYQPEYEIPNCEVSSITYKEKLTQCAPQKIKEHVIRFLSEYGLSVEGRQYDIRDFWIVNRYGEPKLTFRRPESSQLGCSFMIRASKTHYHAYLTCIHCSFNASLPTIGHPGENCPTQLPNLDAKYENLCSVAKNEYDNIEDDQSIVECKDETSIGTDFEGLLTASTQSDTGKPGITEVDEKKKDDKTGSVSDEMKEDNTSSSISDSSEGGESGKPATLLPGPTQSIVTSSCKTTIVERKKSWMDISPAISSQVITTSSQTLEPSNTFPTPGTLSKVGDSSGTPSKVESISSTMNGEIATETTGKVMDLTTEITYTSVSLGKDISVTQGIKTTAYGSTASLSTFGIANLKTLTSTAIPREMTSETQFEDTSSKKPLLDIPTLPISTFESSMTGSSKFMIITTTPSTGTDSYFNESSVPIESTLVPLTFAEPSNSTNISWTTLKVPYISGSTLPPTTETSMPLDKLSSSSEAATKDSVTTCKTTYIPPSKIYTAQNYSYASSASSISVITQPLSNTVIQSSTSGPFYSTSSSPVISEQPESTMLTSISEKSSAIKTEISTQQITATKQFDSATKNFITRKKPTIISTETFPTTEAIFTDAEVITEPSSRSVPLELSTKFGAKSTIFSSILITEKTETGGVLLTSPTPPVSTPDKLPDHPTMMSTQTTTCRTTTRNINTSSTCKTTIPGSKSVSGPSISSSSFSVQLPNQIISTSTTTYKTTIPTAKSSFISTKEATHISSLSVTTDIIPASTGEAIQTSSIKVTEPTAMTTLPSIKFSSYSPGFNITSSISPKTTVDSSKTTQIIKDSIPSSTDFTSTVISDKISTAQAPLSSQLDSTTSSEILTSAAYDIPKITSISIPITKLKITASTSYKATLGENPVTTSPNIVTESSTIIKQTASESDQSLAPISQISISTKESPTIPADFSCTSTNAICRSTFQASSSSIAPISTVSTIIPSKSESADIFSSTFLPLSTLSKNTFAEIISPISSILIPTTTTCRTTSLYSSTIPSTTTCKIIMPITISAPMKTTCRTTELGLDSTTFPPATTCKTRTASTLVTSCKTIIPISKSTEDFIDQMNTEMTQSTIRSQISTLSSSNIVTDISTTTYKPIVDATSNITEQWTQWPSFPTSTYRTTLMKAAISSSSSTCKTTIHQRQPLSSITESLSTTSLISKDTDTMPESTAGVTQSSDFQIPVSISPISTSFASQQSQISSSSPSIIPTTTTYKTTMLFESTMPALASTTTCKTTLITTKSSIPTITTCRTTSITDTSSVITPCKISSTMEAPVSTESNYQPTVKSTATYLTTLLTSKIISTDLILPSTTENPSVSTYTITGSSNICSTTNTPQITTTCKTTLIISNPLTSTCKTTYLDKLETSTLRIQETTSPTEKLNMINTAIPLSSTISKIDCITGSTITPANIEKEILPEDTINVSTLTGPTITTCRTTTAIPLTTTCRTTHPSTDVTTSTCKTTSVYKITSPPMISITDLLSPTTCQTPIIKSSSSEDIHTNAIASLSTVSSAESLSEVESSPPVSLIVATATEKSYSELYTSSSSVSFSSTLKPEELSEIAPAITLSSLSETTTCRITHSSLSSIETSSCKTTIHSRKSPGSSSEPMVTFLTQQPGSPSHISSPSSLADPLTKSDQESAPIAHSTLYSTKPAINIPITSIQTIKSDINTSDVISQSSTETISQTTEFPPLTIPSPSNYETNVSLIPQEDSTILEQLTTKITPIFQDHSISPCGIGSDRTSTCKTTIISHTFMKESETTNAPPNTISALSLETSPSRSSSDFMTKDLPTSSCKTTTLTTIGSITTYKTTIPVISLNLPSTTTCKMTIPPSIHSHFSTSKIFESTTLPPNILPTELLSTATSCRTTLPASLLSSTTTCKTTIPSSLPASYTTCRTTISTILPTIIPSTTCGTTIPSSLPASSETCRTTISTIPPTIIPSTTCRTTIPPSLPASSTTYRTTISTLLPIIIPSTTCRTTSPTSLPTISTCKTTIPTEFPTITPYEPTILTLLPLSNQSISSFIAPISAATSQISPFSSSTVFASSSTSSPPVLEDFKNNTCKTTIVTRPEYPQEITTPVNHMNTGEYDGISTQLSRIPPNLTDISESSVSKLNPIPTSTSVSLTEGLSSRLSTFISSLLPSDWRSPLSQSTNAYPVSVEQTDITSIFLSSLAPNKDTSTFSSPSFNSATTPSNAFITGIAGRMFTSNLTTATASTYVTDVHGYVISSNIPPSELSVIKAFTIPSVSRTTFRSHKGSTLAHTNLFSETTTLSALSTIFSTPPCRTINGTGATCIATTAFDHTGYISNGTFTESANDIFDSRNGTVTSSKPKPCLCINWYLICLIFTIAFVFAWCLLCWQKMLL